MFVFSIPRAGPFTLSAVPRTSLKTPKNGVFLGTTDHFWSQVIQNGQRPSFSAPHKSFHNSQ